MKLEMCPWDTDAPADVKFTYSHKKSKMTYFMWCYALCISKFDKVLIKNTRFRDFTS